METISREAGNAPDGSRTVAPFTVLLCRSMDVVASGIVLLALLPLFALLSMAIVAESGWPVLFRQRRVGINGRLFTMLKFRTMLVNHNGGTITAPGDTRVTKVGRFLRRSKLDELPQFWNVLWGEMGIVGPRPEVPDLLTDYSESDRLIMTAGRPGVTGLSSLLYRDEEFVLQRHDRPIRAVYLEEIVPHKSRIEALYLSRKSVGYDLTIIFCTALYSALPTPKIRRYALMALNLCDRNIH